ncbi:MAG: hypothetical protein NTZ65_03975 [Candidatus Berkelbacteria bacterium]|nr:hypothetical protein [Candidatus Berkelbacteria bacterium]
MTISQNQKDILKTIGLITFATGAIILAPNLLQILKPLNKDKRYRYKKTIKKLYNDKAIYLSGEEIRLTKKGERLLKQIEVEEITIEPKDSWDGNWHLVCYDIPEKYKGRRNYLRRKLIEFNFYQIQKSLWVYPYECQEEIAVLCQNIGVAPFVAYLNTDHLPQQEKLMRLFRLD